MSYEESVIRGNWVDMFRFAALNGTLWAVGTAWSTSIRAVTLTLIPDDDVDVVVGEIAAASLTTIFSVVIIYLIFHCGRPMSVSQSQSCPPQPVDVRQRNMQRVRFPQ